MLKHQIIVDRLSELQKIQILTDVRNLSAPEYIALGVPEFKFSYLKGYKTDIYQSPFSAANSWNLKAISAYAEELSAQMVSENINVVNLPSPIPKLNMTSEGISEDPLVSSKIVSTYLSAANNKGMCTVLDGVYLDDKDVSKLDKIPNNKLVNEFVLRPIKDTVENNSCDGVVVGADICADNYEHVNSKILESISEGGNRAFETARILCKDFPQEETVSKIVSGYICLDGSEAVLKAAVDKYKKLKSGISAGKVSICELEAEVENGTAFSTEELDKAVDNVIDFVFDIVSKYNAKLGKDALDNSISKSLAQESVVLLKNQKNFLPIKINSKDMASIWFAGDIIANYSAQAEPKLDYVDEILEYAKRQGIYVQGFSRGYSMCEEKSDKILDELHLDIRNASTVVLFMGRNAEKDRIVSKTENLYLPANQIAALEKIRSVDKKIIAVVSSDYAVDVTFADYVDALLLAPLNTREGIEAVIDVISGNVSPSGKLAYSLYENTDNILIKQRYYLDQPNAKVGTFIGYRYYDSANYKVAYPFGFGLSFSKFAYSNLFVEGNNVVFTVKNKGKYPASEIAQVYIGLKNVSSRRPKKELVGFDKVFLQPGEATTVSIPISHLEIFDNDQEKWLVELEEYRIYVGSSLTDIRLTANVTLGNVVVDPPQDNLVDYLQSETNIISDKYTLEANYKLMKRNVRNIVFGIGSLVLAISIFGFSLLSETVGVFMVAVSAILAIASAAFFILEGTDRRKFHEQERQSINEANKKHFDDAEVITAYSANKVFADEFDKVGKESTKSYSPVKRTKAENYLEFVNESLTFDIAVRQFIDFASARGYKFEEDTVRELFSAMSASRLIITKGLMSDSFAVIVKLISEYFGTSFAIDMVDSSYVNDGSALFKGEGRAKQKTGLMNTLCAAQNDKSKIYISAFTEVRFAELSNYFVPFARYVRNPGNNSVIQAVDENDRQIKVNLSENVWFIMNLGINESLRNMPSYISELASFIKIEYVPSVPMPITYNIDPFTYYQFDYLLEGLKNKYGISEEVWKKLDSVESFINENVSYAIGNKVCIAVERFFATYKACGGEDNVALDRAIGARIVPSMVVALDTVDDADKKNLSEKLELVFGEENIDVSRGVIRASGSSVI